jgi:basic membrane lipoprotein Med (substrate-binding protein (PBP1-ABC) superfamily)
VIGGKMVGVVRRHTIHAAVFVLISGLLSGSCGRHEQPSDSGFKVRVVTVGTMSGRWEQAAERGLGRIAAELDADVARVRVEDPANERERLEDQGRDGVDLVFCVGGHTQDTLYSVATAYPNTNFVLLPGRARASNVGGIRFLPEEVGYLAGAVAGSLAPDGKIGLLRGDGQPWLEPLEEGYVAGFKSRWRRTKLTAAEGADGAWQLSSAGVLMSLYATDSSQPDVLAAAHNAGLQLIVTDPALIEVAPDIAVAAIDVDVAEAMLRVSREVRDRTFTGREFAFDLGSGVLDVVLNPKLAPDDLTVANEALEEARAEITAGLVEFDGLGL